MSGIAGIGAAGPSGLTTHDLIFLAQNSDKLAEVLKELTDAHGDLDEKIRLAGVAEEIVELRKQIHDDATAAAALRLEAERAHVDAKDVLRVHMEAAKAAATEERQNAASVAADMRKGAREEAERIIDGAQRDVRAQISRAEAMAAEVRDKIEDLAQAEADLKQRTDTADARQANLDAFEQRLLSDEEEMARRKRRIDALFRKGFDE